MNEPAVLRGGALFATLLAVLIIFAGCADLGGRISPEDDGDLTSLLAAGQGQIHYLESLPPNRRFTFGERSLTAAELLASLRRFLAIAGKHFDDEEFKRQIKKNFVLWQPVKKALVTGYYQPRVKASLTASRDFSFPLYAPPKDARRFLARATIERDGLAGLEVAWLAERLDTFFLHIQGSGILVFPDGKQLSARFAAANGLPYTSIGKVMVTGGLLPPGQATMPAIRAWLRKHPERQNEILWQNQRFVFFTVGEKSQPLGNLNLPLTPWRSVALDQNRLPPVAPLLLISRLPRVDTSGTISGWQPLTRFVMPQDIGAAIAGPGHIDLFCGDGPAAEIIAGLLQEEARYYFLLPKSNQP